MSRSKNPGSSSITTRKSQKTLILGAVLSLNEILGSVMSYMVEIPSFFAKTIATDFIFKLDSAILGTVCLRSLHAGLLVLLLFFPVRF